MSVDRQETRRQVAQLVADLYDERISSSEFFARTEALTPADDPEVRELIELVRREPANTWLFGLSGEAERHNAQRIRELVKRFAGLEERGSDSPSSRERA